MNNKILTSLAVLSSIPFLYLIYVKAYIYNLPIDIEIWRFIKEYRTAGLTQFFSIVTHLGDAWLFVLIMISIVIAIIKVKRNINLAAWLGFSALLGAWLMNKLMKEYFIRPRPFVAGYIDNLTYASGYSFPSGHAMGSIICYVLIAYVASIYIKNKLLNLSVFVVLIVLSIIIAISRVYLGVHYPTDVIAGFSFGLFIVNVFIIIRRRFIKL